MARRAPKNPYEQQERRLAALRLRLISLYPFWGYLLAEIQVLWAPALPALAATDGLRRIWLNPQAVQCLNARQLGFVLLHELGHIVLETLDRQQRRDRRLWNIATDYAINRQIAQIELPGSPDHRAAWEAPCGEVSGIGRCEPLFEPTLDHLPAEEIYARLLKNGVASAGDAPWIEVLDVHGDRVVGQPATSDSMDVHVYCDHEPARRQRERDLAAQRLEQAAQLGRGEGRVGPGLLPLGVDRWLSDSQAPRVNWQTQLQCYLADFAAKVERSWAQPHRRWLAEGWLVPGPVSQEDGTVVVAVDTSSSMAPRQLQAIAAELEVLGEVVAELWVLCADAAVHEVVEPGQLGPFLARRRWKGGGGTDHRPVFDWLGAKRLRPDLLICCTDLFTQLPSRAPQFPVLWLALLDEHGDRGPRPHFGALIEVQPTR